MKYNLLNQNNLLTRYTEIMVEKLEQESAGQAHNHIQPLLLNNKLLKHSQTHVFTNIKDQYYNVMSQMI